MSRFLRKTVNLAVILSLLATSLLTGACNFFPTEEEELAPPLMQPATIEYKTEEVKLGTLIQQIRLSAAFYPEIQKSLSFEKQGGRLKSVNVRVGQDVKAGDLIAELDSSSLANSLSIQEIEVQKSQLTVDQLKASQADSYTLKRAKLDLEQQELRLTDLKQQLAATQVVAPIDGEITYVISTSIGEYVNAYQIVAKVADLKELVLVTTADKASDLPIGATVTVEFQKQELQGEVVANPSSLFNDPDENLQKAAIVRISGALPDAVTLGSDARITYVQEQRENVIVLPRTQINMMSGRRYVNVLEDGVRVEKDVEVGLTTDTEAEIVKGLAVGDLVIVN
ncbi:MAG: efflux RND transporter periplasmic adaptor subunit [Clostridiaceae bacterium]|nr:efflux RND transporter periplasmic adaptor subunit [Clostridiaceae bacterium]